MRQSLCRQTMEKLHSAIHSLGWWESEIKELCYALRGPIFSYWLYTYLRQIALRCSILMLTEHTSMFTWNPKKSSKSEPPSVEKKVIGGISSNLAMGSEMDLVQSKLTCSGMVCRYHYQDEGDSSQLDQEPHTYVEDKSLCLNAK